MNGQANADLSKVRGPTRVAHPNSIPKWREAYTPGQINVPAQAKDRAGSSNALTSKSDGGDANATPPETP